MSDNVNSIPTVEMDEDIILPEGFGQGDDIFADPETWTGGSADAQSEREQAEGEEAEDKATDPSPATEEGGLDVAGEEEGKAPATEQTPAEAAPATERTEPKAPNTGKLKFTAQIDRESREIELEESQLPEIYEKAQNLDRVRGKLNRQQALVDSFEATAKRLGYKDARELLEKAEAGYITGEVERLKSDGVHEEVARDMVRRRMDQAAPQQSRETGAQAEPDRGSAHGQERPARDFREETMELLRQRPELRGKALPEEVIRACAQEGKRLPVAYAEYETRQERAKAEKLRQENAVLKQNAKNAARAPVKPSVGGGSTGQEPQDDFLKGFVSEY